MPRYKYLTLPNGLRLVHCAGSPSVECCGVAVNVGSRDELPDSFGLAHFVEHTIFKGTSRRRSYHIINRMEAVGGELNAYTTKESTVVYSLFPAGNLSRATELIADLVMNSVFPEHEIAKEREVVADEIQSYLDIPAEAIFDDFEDAIFAGSGLGHNILGTVNAVAQISSEQCVSYLHRFYRPSNMVFFYCGTTPFDKVVRQAERAFGSMASEETVHHRTTPPTVPPFHIENEIGSHQAHCIVGCRIHDMFSRNRYATALLTNILGGPGMNSLLNVELREKRGLVYSVDATTALFTDSGAFTIYFGCDHDDLARCERLARNVVTRLADTSLSDRALDRAKRQYIGQLTVASDNCEQMALSAARATLYHGEALEPDVVRQRILAVTPTDVRLSAETMVDQGLSTFILR